MSTDHPSRIESTLARNSGRFIITKRRHKAVKWHDVLLWSCRHRTSWQRVQSDLPAVYRSRCRVNHEPLYDRSPVPHEWLLMTATGNNHDDVCCVAMQPMSEKPPQPSLTCGWLREFTSFLWTALTHVITAQSKEKKKKIPLWNLFSSFHSIVQWWHVISTRMHIYKTRWFDKQFVAHSLSVSNKSHSSFCCKNVLM